MQSNEKIQLLVSAAKLYYLENKTQNEIAKLMGVSRPMISKYLQEARQLGIVKIEINDFTHDDTKEALAKTLCDHFHLKALHIVPASKHKNLNDKLFNEYLLKHLLQQCPEQAKVGLGWGSAIGKCIEQLATLPEGQRLKGEVVAIIGNAPISYRSYHTNELVRMVSEKTGLEAHYMYAPVLCENVQEQEALMQTQQVQAQFARYDKLDYIVTQIRNFPSVPDLATQVRFEKKLHKARAVGMVLGYYYNREGTIITSTHDYSIQIQEAALRNAPNTIAIMNAHLNISAVIGALRTGLFDTVFMSEQIVDQLLEDNSLNL